MAWQTEEHGVELGVTVTPSLSVTVDPFHGPFNSATTIKRERRRKIERPSSGFCLQYVKEEK